jgi:tRNA(Leu) C34 or U34 (ribose-2'-O)-methylase TrmL
MTTRGYFAVGLCRPKCGENIGSALRACYAFGAAMLAVQWRNGVRYSTDTMSAWRHLPVLRVDDLKATIPYDCIPVAIEITDKSKPLETFNHPERAFYVFGPEDGSIPPGVLEWCPQRIVIPTRYCLNLATAVSVVLYDRVAKRSEGFSPPVKGTK